MTETASIALVTGASRGIGKAIALGLGQQGHTLVGTATTPLGAEAISTYIRAAGLQGCGMLLDVVDESSIETLMSSIKTRFATTPAILVNNAGITRDNLLLRMKADEWDRIIATNLTSVFRMSQKVVRGMMKNRWGRIVSIGSVVGSMGNQGQANYAAAKAGLVGFSKSLAREIGSRGVTVNVVAPGFIDTDMTRSLDDSQREVLQKQIPVGRLGQPEEIANVVAFLCSQGAGYITGETIHVNGGMLMP